MKLLGIYLTFTQTNYDSEVEILIRELLDNKENVLVLHKNNYSILLFYSGRLYEVWLENKWYAYFRKFYVHDVIPSKNGLLISGNTREFLDKRPSKKILYEFSETFDTPELVSRYSPYVMREVFTGISDYLKRKYKKFKLKKISFETSFVFEYIIRKMDDGTYSSKD